MLIVGYALAALVGISLGMLGGGGSILTVPIFVYVLGFDPKLAIAMSLPVVGGASFVGALSHWRAGNVRLATAALFGVIAMAGAYAGARLSVYLSGTAQLLLLGITMLGAAVSMLRSARSDAAKSATPDTRSMPLALLFPVALGVGALTGLVGIGGGFLIVPALVVLAGVSMKQAVGTSLLVISMNSMSGFAGYVGRVELPWSFMLVFMAIAAAGILVGTRLIRLVSQTALKQGFAVFLIILGAFIVLKNLSA